MKRMYKLIAAIVCISVFMTFLVPVNASPDNNLDRLDAYLREYESKIPAPGFSIVVVQDDRIVFTKGYGIEKEGAETPMSENTASGIGSLTKSFTAMALLQLAEQGKLELDDPVVKHLPWFRTLDKEKSDRITVRMLLGNTSGIPSLDRWTRITETSDEAMEKAIRGLASFPLNSEPGEAFEYSNEGFMTAGVLIEQITGMKYKDYIQKNILDALKMDRSTMDPKRIEELGALYGHNAGIVKAKPVGYYFNSIAYAAGSELRCSAENLGHYLIALLNGGRYETEQVISGSGIEQMWTPVAAIEGGNSDAESSGNDGYALGWQVSDIDGRKIVHHGGNTGTMSSYTMLYPDKKLGVAMLMNLSGLNAYEHQSLATVVNNVLHIVCGEPLTAFGDKTGKDPHANTYELPSGQRQEYSGEYLSASGDLKIRITENGKGELQALIKYWAGDMEADIDFVTPGSAVLRNMSMALPAGFTITAEGRVTGMNFSLLGTFFKVSADMHGKFAKVTAPSKKMSFRLPLGYETAWEENGFTAKQQEGKLTITGELISRESFSGSLDSVVETRMKEVLAGTKVIRKGAEYVESLAGNVVKETCYLVEKEGTRLHRVFIYTEIGNRVFFMTTETEHGDVTAVVRDVLLPVMNSISLE